MNKSTPRVYSYRERQLALGNKKREPYLNDDEWLKVKAFILKLRESNGNSN